jgi:cytochrome b561
MSDPACYPTNDPASSVRYPACIRWLHWAVALGVAVQLALGWGSEVIDADDGMRLLGLHFQLGLMLLLLMLLRLVCRLLRRMPSTDIGTPTWQRRAAKSLHVVLYGLLFLLPVSGYVIWVWMGAPRLLLGIVTMPALFVPPADDETWRAFAWYVHVACAWAVSALVTLHVSAALWHQWIVRDGRISRRML